mmetsp:Transcript_5305/g.10484  ORF Transcript_5305/g.10484 Transcript_5305/m.10484 type:complete len:499 (+) Transcript_5305:509-2005(+)
MDFKKRSLERRMIGGSLPFKKRCFRSIEQQLGTATSSAFSAKAAFCTTTNTHDLSFFANSYATSFADAIPHKIHNTGSAFSSHHHRHHQQQRGSQSWSASEDEDDDEESSTGPLPGHCHGRTGSTQAFCQRLPCYKGSNYCKRHYEHYVLKGNSVPTPTGKSAPGTEEKAAPHRSPVNQQQQQDKRCTGSKGEIRCKATTTRGRECAYIAANGTKYCHMHAEYDTNPPPRRGGRHAPEVPTKTFKKKDMHRSSSSSVSDSSTAKSTGVKRRNTAEKLAQKHADSPFPLLSMISSDQWANKRVRISMGPFEGHIGHVEKWSNGWVGVRIPDVGLHNRRSFELYLDGEDETLRDLPQEQREAIKRCVSRDGATPSPLSEVKRTPSPKGAYTPQTYQPVTPNPTMEEAEMRVISKSRSLEGIEMVSLPEVTPTEARAGRVCVQSPMIESLLASQERDSKLDLLFGTAALDRGRRNIRRPKIYEDTEMLDKKRARKVSLGMD